MGYPRPTSTQVTSLKEFISKNRSWITSPVISLDIWSSAAAFSHLPCHCRLLSPYLGLLWHCGILVDSALLLSKASYTVFAAHCSTESGRCRYTRTASLSYSRTAAAQQPHSSRTAAAQQPHSSRAAGDGSDELEELSQNRIPTGSHGTLCTCADPMHRFACTCLVG